VTGIRDAFPISGDICGERHDVVAPERATKIGSTLLDALHTCEPLRCHGARRRWPGRQAGEDGRTVQ
jgi:hypothetical protein